MQVSAIGNRVTKVAPNAKANGSIAVVDRHLLLHFYGAAYRPIDAVEHDEQRVAPGLDDPAAMFLNGGID
jgi:hypothetical protein